MKKIQEYLLYLYFFSINFELIDPFDTGIDFFFTKVTAILYIISTLFTYKSIYSLKDVKIYIYPIIAFFVLLTFMNIIYATSDSTNLLNVAILLNIIIVFASINQCKKDPKIILKGLFFFALGSIVITLIYLLGIHLDFLDERVTVYEINQNELGLRLCISIIILSTIIFKNSLKLGMGRYLLLITLPIMILFLVKTGSRTAFISLFLALIFYLIFFKSKSFINKLLLISSSIIASSLLYYLFIKNSLLSDRLMNTLYEGDLSGRNIRWYAAFELISNNLLFGVGQSGYSVSIENILGFYSSPHNVIIEILCYTGLLGLTIMLYFYFEIYHAIRVIYSYNKNIFPILLIIPIIGMILSGQILYTKIAWMIFVYIIVMERSINL